MSAEDGNIFNEDTARRLWEEYRRRVAEANPDEEIDFIDMEFPEDPAEKYFYGITFHSHVDFSGAKFLHSTVFNRSIFEKDADFNNCIFYDGGIFLFTEFQGMADFENAVFEAKAKFAGVIFKEDAVFSNSTFNTIAVFESEESITDGEHKKTEFKYYANFEKCVWKEHVQFLDVVFHNDACFQNGVFEYETIFDRCDIKGIANFENVRFIEYSGKGDKRKNRTRFQGNKFEGKVDFGNSRFDCPISFTKNDFRDQVGFFRAVFNKSVSIEQTNRFHDRLILDESYKSFSSPQDAIYPYRIAKQTAQQAGDSRWTGQYHYIEQCASNEYERKAAIWKPWRKEFWKRSTNGLLLWGEYIIGRGLFGYGEKPLRPLCAGGLVIVICAVIFCLNHGLSGVDNSCSFGNALYFSIVTFTTLGYGDITAMPSMRWLSATEAILGAALMSLFIVALARKFSR